VSRGTDFVFHVAALVLCLGEASTTVLRGCRCNTRRVGPADQTGMSSHPTPTLDDMKRMADKKAEPLLAKLKTDPNNAQ
jgi:hypothetical protein